MKNVNLSFTKGEKIGIVGETGCGKSTLIDLMMGLLTPSSGELLVDGIPITSENRIGWKKHISHVPQSIFIADTSIQENIALGVSADQIDQAKILNAATQAEIGELLNRLSKNSTHQVGERGVQLSGGQRQRIGIARALYGDSDVLFFDEATSALDTKTEEKIINGLTASAGNKLLFMVAHRLTTLKGCDRILKINSDSTIVEVKYAGLEVGS